MLIKVNSILLLICFYTIAPGLALLNNNVKPDILNLLNPHRIAIRSCIIGLKGWLTLELKFSSPKYLKYVFVLIQFYDREPRYVLYSKNFEGKMLIGELQTNNDIHKGISA